MHSKKLTEYTAEELVNLPNSDKENLEVIMSRIEDVDEALNAIGIPDADLYSDVRDLLNWAYDQLDFAITSYDLLKDKD
jgi:phage-related protein